LRFEPLETRAYPGALLWGWGWNWPGVGDALTPRCNLDLSSSVESTPAPADDDVAEAIRKLHGVARPELPAMDVENTDRVDTNHIDTDRANHALRPRLRDVPPESAVVRRAFELLDNFTAGSSEQAGLPILKTTSPAIASSLPPLGGAGGAQYVGSSGGGGGHSARIGAAGSASGATGSASASATAGADSATVPPAAANETPTPQSPLALVDASGAPMNVALDANTLVVGAATWCSACAAFKEALAAPGVAQQLAGLRLVFAFGDEGGTGIGGVENEAFLQNLPGEVAFLAPGSVRPEGFPMAFNSVTGAFDQSAFDAVGAWLNRNELATTNPAQPALALVDAAGAPINLAFDANTLVVGAATWCGATAKFKAALNEPAVAEQLTGLRIVFAFENEGGDGPGGVLHPEFLDDLPGDVAFLGVGSVRPERFPTVYNPATGQFDQTAVAAVNAWALQGTATGDLVSGKTCANKNVPGSGSVSPGSTPTLDTSGGEKVPDPLEVGSGSGGPGGGGSMALFGDYNNDGAVGAADYTVWRDTLGSTTDLRADGNGDLMVNQLDYDIWKDKFGNIQALVPGAFSITGPASPIEVGTFSVTWGTSLEATSYDFNMSFFSNCSSPFRSENIVGNSANVLSLNEGTIYICIDAVNAAGIMSATNSPYELVIDFVDLQQTIFVTATNYFVDFEETIPPFGGTFGSAAAADYHCTNLANQAGLLTPPWDGTTMVFRALMSESFVDAQFRSGISAYPFINVNGDIVAAGNGAIYAGNFSAPILNQNGQAVAGIVPVWTGSTGFGVWSGFTCEDWDNPFASGGTVGNLNGAGTTWLDNGTRACNLGARLYCVGFRQTP
jgi:hypothetical protein